MNCCYCERPIILPLMITKEHLLPKSKGGNSSKYNLRKCCNKCNEFRSNLSYVDFIIKITSFLKGKKSLHPEYTRMNLIMMHKNCNKLNDYVISNLSTLKIKCAMKSPKKNNQTLYISYDRGNNKSD